jgi:hypothetical protein
MDQRRSWAWALAAVVGIGALATVGVLVWSGDDGTDDVAPTSSTDRPTMTSTSSTAVPSTTTTTEGGPGAVPRAVEVVTAGPGGGSGEVVLDWDTVTGATGYRVLRSGSRDGPFEVVADFDVTTGSTTASADVVNIWSEQHSYVPSEGTLDAPDRSPWFQYVDVSGSEQRCYRVVTYNAVGDGAASVVVCSSPP